MVLCSRSTRHRRIRIPRDIGDMSWGIRSTNPLHPLILALAEVERPLPKEVGPTLIPRYHYLHPISIPLSSVLCHFADYPTAFQLVPHLKSPQTMSRTIWNMLFPSQSALPVSPSISISILALVICGYGAANWEAVWLDMWVSFSYHSVFWGCGILIMLISLYF